MDAMLRPEFDKLVEAGSKAYWIKPDEKRRMWHNLPPTEGGDKLWIPVNMAAGGEPVDEAAPAEDEPDDEPEEEEPLAKRAMPPFGR
jgi:hypothetical protein